MEHANDAIKERLSKLGGQYTPKSIKRVARYLDDLFHNISVITFIYRHCLTPPIRTMGLAKELNKLLTTPYEDEGKEDKAGPRLIKRRGKFQVLFT